MPPKHIEVEGSIFDLTCEYMSYSAVILTYEHRPLNETCFLLSVMGKTLEEANANMTQHLLSFNYAADNA